MWRHGAQNSVAVCAATDDVSQMELLAQTVGKENGAWLMWCTRGKAMTRESIWDTTTTEDIVSSGEKACSLWEVATDSSASTCLLPRYQWYCWYQCQDSTPPVKMAESDVKLLGKALAIWVSWVLRLKTKFCTEFFGAHSHEGWHQWSGTLVAIPKAIRSIFLWSLSLADRWRNLWNLWSFRSTEREDYQSTINLEKTLKMCWKPLTLNHTRFDQKSLSGNRHMDSMWKMRTVSGSWLETLVVAWTHT